MLSENMARISKVFASCDLYMEEILFEIENIIHGTKLKNNIHVDLLFSMLKV